MTAAITLEQVTKAFGNRKAIDSLSLEVEEGAFLSIFGPNGAGKTTLLRMISTLSAPSEGRISLCGISTKEEPERARARVGLISHNAMLYPDLTAQENLEFFARLYGIEDPTARALELLDAVGLRMRRHDAVRTFSRGMTQRLAIARAFVNDPAIVLLDEPYSGLDPHAVDIFDSLIARMREGRTFVMVSHDLAKGFGLCTHALILAKGRAVAFGPKEGFDEAEFGELYRKTVGMGVS